MESENKMFNGIHYSRFIITWIKSGGNVKYMRKWLKSLIINERPIPENVINDIILFSNLWMIKGKLLT